MTPDERLAALERRLEELVAKLTPEKPQAHAPDTSQPRASRAVADEMAWTEELARGGRPDPDAPPARPPATEPEPAPAQLIAETVEIKPLRVFGAALEPERVDPLPESDDARLGNCPFCGARGIYIPYKGPPVMHRILCTGSWPGRSIVGWPKLGRTGCTANVIAETKAAAFKLWNRRERHPAEDSACALASTCAWFRKK